MSTARVQALRGHLAMLVFSAVVAGSFSLGGQIAVEVDPVVFTTLRFVVAATAVLIIVLARGTFRAAHFQAPWRYLVLGGFYGIYFVAMFEGLKTAPPVSTAAVFTLTPIMSAIFGWWMMRQATTMRIAVALAIGAVGALWVIFRADFDAFLAFEIGRGEGIYFLGCIAHAAYTPAARALNRGEPLLSFTLGTVLASLLIVALWAGRDLIEFHPADWRPLVWVTLFYTALAATALTVVLVFFATLRLPSAKVMAYTYLVPAWVALWEIALGNAAPPAMVLVGVGLILGALVLLLAQDPA